MFLDLGLRRLRCPIRPSVCRIGRLGGESRRMRSKSLSFLRSSFLIVGTWLMVVGCWLLVWSIMLGIERQSCIDRTEVRLQNRGSWSWKWWVIFFFFFRLAQGASRKRAAAWNLPTFHGLFVTTQSIKETRKRQHTPNLFVYNNQQLAQASQPQHHITQPWAPENPNHNAKKTSEKRI